MPHKKDIEIIIDIKKCEKIWELFSRNLSVFDLWDFRVSFYEGYGFQPYFITIYDKGRPTACAPLWFNKEKKIYEWFGGDWHEDSIFFFKDNTDYSLLVKAVPFPHTLLGIMPETIPSNEKKYFVEDLPQYCKSIKGMNFDDLLASFTKKHRYNLKYDYKKILERNPKVEFIIGKDKQLVLLEELKKMSMKRFHGLNGRLVSCFSDVHEFESFRSIIKNQGKYKALGIVTKIEENIAAVDFILTYKKVYYLLTGANDLTKYPGVGNFMNYLEFKNASEEKMDVINAMQEDHNWKHKYFDEKPLLKLEKKTSH